ncbi:Hypothetical_protein [Hexamita inflata]|uniref:Hypothetical_protein n=1 Tax=Hexamita inflata TaxID=28002 RepID=A0AA86UDF5_9EUKA|nr:Hypothetical protein HINF_LOCUS41408 [Hexamita inflata]CAI9953770.1 Hypothetical protein HINF_LOCUS41415 [Hexamita inflata]
MNLTKRSAKQQFYRIVYFCEAGNQMKFLPVPDATKKQLYACGSLNMIVPGSGLLLLSARTFEMRGVFVACLQFATWFFVFGWVWAAVNGLKMIRNGRNQE